MKLTIPRDTLIAALAVPSSILVSSATILALKYVRIEAKFGAVIVTATDMDREVTVEVAAEVEQTGAVCVPGKGLADIVKALPAGASVRMEMKPDKRIQIASGRSKSHLPTFKAADFPVFTSVSKAPPATIELAGTDLLAAIDQVECAVSTEETRYYLNGIFLHQMPAANGNKPVLRMVTTDGHRMTRTELQYTSMTGSLPGATSDRSIIIPRAALPTIKKMIGNATAVTIEVSSSIKITAGTVSLRSKLIDGTFPDYERVIPSGNPHHLTIDGGVLNAAVNRICAVAADLSKGVGMIIRPDGISLRGKGEAGADITDEVDAAGRFNHDIDIGFNGVYLRSILDALGASSGGDVVVELNDPASPSVWRLAAGGPVLAVLMPMRAP